MSGQQRLVGRDDVLAGPEHFDLNLLGDPGPADEFDADPDGRIVQQAIQIGGEHPRRQLNRARPRRVGVNDARQLRTHAHLGGDDIGIFENQLGHAGADRAEPNHSHSYAFVFHSSHLLLSSSLSGPPQPGASHNGMWGHG